MHKAFKTFGSGILFAVVTVAAAVGQSGSSESKNEFGFTIGGELVPDNSTQGSPSVQINIGSSVAFQLHYARRLVAGKRASIFFEVPASAAPSHTLTSPNVATPVSLATFFVTPSFRLSLKPGSRFSPWLSFGGGYGLYEGSENLGNGVANPDRFTSTGALQWGAGADVQTGLKIFFPISLRGEIRDFYTLDTLDFNTPVTNNSQHNVVVGGGFFWRF
jgi:opacity protein-like surface antigen